MTLTLQVVYPAAPGTRFDHDYYRDTHLPLVDVHMGAHLSGATASRGLSDSEAAPFHAIATLHFADKSALDAALAVAGPVLDDIPKFTDAVPQMLVGEVIA